MISRTRPAAARWCIPRQGGGGARLRPPQYRRLDRRLREKPLDAILVTTSGCGTMVKDYGNLLARDRGYAERAAYVGKLARDITEFISEVGLVPPVYGPAYASPITRLLAPARAEADTVPPTLLEQAGFNILDVPEGHLCCGSAGTYNLLEPELSGQLRERKLANIAKVEPDVIATANIGCMTQLQGGTTAPSSTPSRCSTGPPAGPRPTCSARSRPRAIRSRPWSSSPSKPPWWIKQRLLSPLGRGRDEAWLRRG